MNNQEIHSIWAPDTSVWSTWAKPVLFAYLDSTGYEFPVPGSMVDVSWSPSPGEKVGLVLDLPGAEGVAVGVALAERGYRPVPLYNALPMPVGRYLSDPLSGGEISAVNVFPIINALRNGAEQLAELNLPADAPPVFLLDANRQGAGRKMLPGDFDNRSISFTTDFPSANFLIAHGVQRVMLVQRTDLEPKSDLAHSLRRWQDGGIKLERLRLDPPSRPEPFQVGRPPWYGVMFQRALASLGVRRSGTGGFGAWIADSSAGG
jgi:hypothetical protein